jgi:hypothetical protein
MDRTPPPVPLTAALALPRTPGRSTLEQPALVGPAVDADEAAALGAALGGGCQAFDASPRTATLAPGSSRKQ